VSRTGAALGTVSGFLAGVLVVLALGAGGDDTRTVTEARTVTVPGTVTTGGTVIVTTAVPALVGERLDVAKERLDRAGFDPDVSGGGIFGIVEESNWEVVTQDPGPGVMLEQGSSVHIRVEKR
jgi:beta-lactam-binding protein with PASTA domain